MKRKNKDRFYKFRRRIQHHYNTTAQGSSIIIGSSNCSSYVNCGGDQLTEMEAEMLRLFRSFDMRKKTEAMACLFRIEDNMKGVDNLG